MTTATSRTSTPTPRPPLSNAMPAGGALVRFHREFAQLAAHVQRTLQHLPSHGTPPLSVAAVHVAYGDACCRFVVGVLSERPSMLGSYHATLAGVLSVCDTVLGSAVLPDGVEYEGAEVPPLEAHTAMVAAIAAAWWADTMASYRATSLPIAGVLMDGSGATAGTTAQAVMGTEVMGAVGILLALEEQSALASFGAPSLSSLTAAAGKWREALRLRIVGIVACAWTYDDGDTAGDMWTEHLALLTQDHRRSVDHETKQPSSYSWLNRYCWSVVWAAVWPTRYDRGVGRGYRRTQLEAEAALCGVSDAASISDDASRLPCNQATFSCASSLQRVCLDVVFEAAISDPLAHWPATVVEAVAFSNCSPLVVDAITARLRLPSFADALVAMVRAEAVPPALAVAACGLGASNNALGHVVLSIALHDVQCYAVHAAGRYGCAPAVATEWPSSTAPGQLRAPAIQAACQSLVHALLRQLFQLPFLCGGSQRGTAVDLELTALMLLEHAQRRLVVAPEFDAEDAPPLVRSAFAAEVALLAAVDAVVSAVAHEHGGLSVPRSVLSRWRRTLIAVADAPSTLQETAVADGTPLFVSAALPKDTFAAVRAATATEGRLLSLLTLEAAVGSSPAAGIVAALGGGALHPLLGRFGDAVNHGACGCGPRRAFHWAPVDAVTATVVVDGWLTQTVDIAQLHVLHIVLHHAYPCLFQTKDDGDDAIDVDRVVAAHVAALHRCDAPDQRKASPPPPTPLALKDAIGQVLVALRPLLSILRRHRDVVDWRPDAATTSVLSSATFRYATLRAAERQHGATSVPRRAAAQSTAVPSPAALLRAEAFLVRQGKALGTTTVNDCAVGYVGYVRKHSAGLVDRNLVPSSDKLSRQLAADVLLSALRTPAPEASPADDAVVMRHAVRELLAAAKSVINKGFLATAGQSVAGEGVVEDTMALPIDEHCRLSFVPA